MNIFYFGLACWRITSLLYQESGPFDIFLGLRKFFGIEHGSDGDPVVYPNTFFGKLFECIWCLSVWVGFVLVLAYIFLPNITIYFAIAFSLSTITIMVNEWLAALR